jgi:neopullulanase
MTTSRSADGARARLAAVVAFAATLSGAAPARAEAPEVLKLEPPNWWPGHSINPVRVLIRGRHLGVPRVEALGGGVGVGLVRVNAAGTSLFVDVHIDADAQPGPRRLRITTPVGAAEAAFEVATPLPREGRFQGFSSDDVMYLVMPDRFANGDPRNDDPPASRGLHDRKRVRYYHGGDLKGVSDRLPYLKDLGVTALWLNPWYDNVNHLNEKEQYGDGPITDYHGYGAVDFYTVDEHLGTLAELRELVDAAHRLGIKVVQDQVANHTGPNHPWVDDPPTPTWYNGTENSHLANKWQTWTFADPHATSQSQEETLRGWFIDILPDLNQDDEETARYVIQNTLWWIGITGLDGIRQDTLPYVHRRFWREWMAAIKREYPRLTVVGELFDGDPALVSFYEGGATRFDGIDTGIDTLFDFPLYYPIRRAFAEGRPLREVAMMLARDHLYVRPGELVTFLGLHDVGRFMSEPGATIAGLKLAFTLLMTARGLPLVYYGDEIAMPGGGDPDNRRDFPGGWPGDPRNAFTLQGRTPDEQSVFEHVRRLARLRAELPPLRRGRMVNLLVEEQRWAFARIGERGVVVVAFNNEAQAATLDVAVGGAGLYDGRRLIDRLGVGPELRVARGRVRVMLPGRSVAVYVPE